ncbi:calcium binding protein 39-like protein [Rozella allomycis CSF55]|uniref:Calcium binding protein 39-like protein n=1 Tax=Rozella allomycis (strain CSF55) TaxID=988480 RepID=A0A4P9YL64_ROZAC|nr:calcium binding protein 39-like protein [Rozella allomycis CSF55]
MSFLFKPKLKSPQDLVKSTREAIIKLEQKSSEKATEEISKNLFSMKSIFYGEPDSEPSPENMANLAGELLSSDLLDLLVQNIAKLEFEARKDTAQIYTALLRRQVGVRSPTVEYILAHENILFSLLKGYENQEIALNCGLILRECTRHESLAKLMLLSPSFNQFYEYVELPTFDIASDAFATFKDLLTKHKSLVADYLQNNYDLFFEKYTTLLNSNNYVTKRQSLKLLGELLLDRSNFDIMTKYISSVENLKLMMNLLRDKSKNIQFEAFHVFKVFVANPNKTKPVLDVLFKNQEKLITFLSNFHNERSDDEQFNDEKAYLIKQIQQLEISS